MKFVRYLIVMVAAGNVFVGCGRNPANDDASRFTFDGQQASKTSEDAIGSLIRSIEIENKFGDVKIRVSAESPAIRWNVTCWSKTSAKAEKFLDKVQLKKFKSGIDQSWKLEVPERLGGISGLNSDLTLTVPAGMKVKVQNQNGNIDVSGLTSTVELRNQHGKVLVRDLSGMCKIDNAHGSVEARNVATVDFKNSFGNTTVNDVLQSLTLTSTDGHVVVNNVSGESSIHNVRGNLTAKNLQQNAELETAFGSLTADNIAGPAMIKNRNGKTTATGLTGPVDVESNVGPIRIESSAARIKCQNQNGEIVLVLTNPQLESVRAATSFNDILVVLPQELNPNFSLTAERGSVDSEFEADETETSSDGPLVQLQTKNGNLIIRKATE